ncbi:MAG TPA: twin-arginine translocation signal domain-containing protein [Gammaproteobacteria bacterium]|nr:twin-arginine translocation signal domain-containing protein [Gammaproteobacteria bacterium]
MSDEHNGVSRRGFLSLTFKSAVAVAGVGLAAAQGEAAPPKVAQAAVSYRDKPKDGHQCSQCRYYQGDNVCSKVKGHISPHGWCAMFTPKS